MCCLCAHLIVIHLNVLGALLLPPVCVFYFQTPSKLRMAMQPTYLETPHTQAIADVAYDYYGTRIATAAMDGIVAIYNVAAQHIQQQQHQQQQQPEQQLLCTLNGHDGPVVSVAFAHPKFGPLLATAGYDGRVIVWKESAPAQWQKVYENSRADAACTATAFAPHQYGLVLATSRTDGSVTVTTRQNDQQWTHLSFHAHNGGVNSVSWAPNALHIAPADSQQQHNPMDGARLVTAGCDCRIRMWRFDASQQQWHEIDAFPADAHSNWVRDVAWAPSMGLPTNIIASASEDCTVILWTDNTTDGSWAKAKTLVFEQKPWRVSWSVLGNILAVAQGDSEVSLWKETIDGDWQRVNNAI